MKHTEERMNLEEAGRMMRIPRKDLAFLFQDNKFPKLGFAYKNKKGKNYIYVIYKPAVMNWCRERGLI